MKNEDLKPRGGLSPAAGCSGSSSSHPSKPQHPVLSQMGKTITKQTNNLIGHREALCKEKHELINSLIINSFGYFPWEAKSWLTHRFSCLIRRDWWRFCCCTDHCLAWRSNLHGGEKTTQGCFSALHSVARNEDFILGETKRHRRNTPWGVVGLKMSRIARKQTGFWGHVVWMEKNRPKNSKTGIYTNLLGRETWEVWSVCNEKRIIWEK